MASEVDLGNGKISDAQRSTRRIRCIRRRDKSSQSMVCHLLSGCFDKVGVAENINIVHFLLITGDHDFGRFVKNSTSS